jgi:hypothetical protein
MEDEEKRIRDELSGAYMEISKEFSFLSDNIDSFVALSREKTSIIDMEFYAFDSDPGNSEVWDKVGQMVGNFTKLQVINIHLDFDGDGNRCSPDWEILTRILRYLRRKVALCSSTDETVEEIQGLARVIHGHPMISECTSLGCTFET